MFLPVIKVLVIGYIIVFGTHRVHPAEAAAASQCSEQQQQWVDSLGTAFKMRNPALSENMIGVFKSDASTVLNFGARCGIESRTMQDFVQGICEKLRNSVVVMAVFKEMLKLPPELFRGQCEAFYNEREQWFDGYEDIILEEAPLLLQDALKKSESVSAKTMSLQELESYVETVGIPTIEHRKTLVGLIKKLEKQGVSFQIISDYFYAGMQTFKDLHKVHTTLDVEKLMVHMFSFMARPEVGCAHPVHLNSYLSAKQYLNDQARDAGYQRPEAEEIDLGDCNMVEVSVALKKMAELGNNKGLCYKKTDNRGYTYILSDMHLQEKVIRSIKETICHYERRDRVESCIKNNAFLDLLSNYQFIKIFLEKEQSLLTKMQLGNVVAHWRCMYGDPTIQVTDDFVIEQSVLFYIAKQLSKAGLVTVKDKKGNELPEVKTFDQYCEIMTLDTNELRENIRFLNIYIKDATAKCDPWKRQPGSLLALLLLIASSSSVSLLGEFSTHYILASDLYFLSGNTELPLAIRKEAREKARLYTILRNQVFVSSLLACIGLGSEADRTSFLTELYPPVVDPVKTKKQIEEEKAQAKAERQRAHKRMLKMAALEAVVGQNGEADQGEKVDMLEHAAAAAEGEKEQLEFKKRNEEWFLHCKMPALSRVKACVEPEEKTAYVVKKDTVDEAKLIQEKEEIKKRQAAATKRRIEARKKRRQIALARFWNPIMVRLINDYNYFHNKVGYESRIVATTCKEKPVAQKTDSKIKQMSTRSLQQQETNCDFGVVTTPDGVAAAFSASVVAARDSVEMVAELQGASAASAVPVERVYEQEQGAMVSSLPAGVEAAPKKDYYQGSLQQCLTRAMQARHMKEKLAREVELRNAMIREDAEARAVAAEAPPKREEMPAPNIVQHNPYQPCFRLH